MELLSVSDQVGTRLRMRLSGINLFVTLLLSTFAATCALAAGPESDNSKITKCKDSNGVWHYGDFASDHCAVNSDITELNQQGVRVKVEAATRDVRDSATLSAVSKRKAELQKIEQEARDRDLRLLAMYESVDDLLSTRDERVEYLDSVIRADQEILGHLHNQHSSLTELYQQQPNKRVASELQSTEESMELYERVIADRLRAKKDLMRRFDVDIQRYQGLVQMQKAKERAQAGY